MPDIRQKIQELTQEDFEYAFNTYESVSKEYPASRYYDIVYQGNDFPPKPIIALAYQHKYNEKIKTGSFGEGKGSIEFLLIEKLGYQIQEKKKKKTTDFKSFLELFEKKELEVYLNLLKKILVHFNLKVGDERLTFNYYDNTLFVTVGQRYVLNFYSKNSEYKFVVLSKKPIGDHNSNSKFNGNPIAYFNKTNHLDFSQDELKSILDGVEEELNRSKISGYRKWNKIDFEKYIFEQYHIKEIENNIVKSFSDASKKYNLFFPTFLIKRYIASLATKPFVIFTGLSGSGKTKLAQTFAKWICDSDEQYKIIPVGADWTNREPLLGYSNSLETTKYVLPDNGALDLILAAIENRQGKELKECKPYFLILDEMNLSHVERYFADFLSGMESKEDISLYTGNERKDEKDRTIPQQIKLPPNLFIVGTVNIDETTYMFSPKVLDRANTIEFRVDKNDLAMFLDLELEENNEPIDGSGKAFRAEFMQLVERETEINSKYNNEFLGFFEALQPIGAEFGYRTANEMNRLMAMLELLGLEENEKSLDVAVMQKLLPKIHGSRTKLTQILPILASFCVKDQNIEMVKQLFDGLRQERQIKEEKLNKIILPLSFAKIARMYRSAQENGFASYAEG